MKKLMIAASAALCATVGFSLESANVVGYSTQTANATRNTMMAPTFLSVDSATGCKLSDLTVTGYDAPELNEDDEFEGGCSLGDFILQFLNSNGSIANRYYWIDDGETTPGWYTQTGAEVDATKVDIPAGVASWVYGSGYTLQSAGAVNSKDIAFKMNATRHTAAGNSMPTDLTLAKLTVTGYDAPELNEDDEYEGGCSLGDFILQFLNSNGSVAARYYWIDDGETTPGWYTQTGAEVDATKVDVVAGKGAWIYGSGMTLNIPAPTL